MFAREESQLDLYYEDRPVMLVVDDQRQNQQMLQRLFEDTFDLAFASSGSDALAMLETTPFDVLLLDIVMDGLDGLEVLRIIRRQKRFDTLPVILISALADHTMVAHGLELGANDYITRPFSAHVVRARVHNQVASKRLIDSHRAAIEEMEHMQMHHIRLMRMVTHDLRKPIANLRMGENLLRRVLQSDEQSIQVLDGMALAMEAMQEVMEDFFGAITLEQLQFNCAPVQIDKLLFSLGLQYQMLANSKGIRFTLTPETTTVFADEARLSQAISNLVSNAIKYSDPGTDVLLYSEIVGDSVRICVRDHGPGVRVEEREQLFTEFSRLTNKPTGNETSTGLGLWIVKNLVEGMHGEVGVTFPDDGGSVFWIELPIAEFA